MPEENVSVSLCTSIITADFFSPLVETTQNVDASINLELSPPILVSQKNNFIVTTFNNADQSIMVNTAVSEGQINAFSSNVLDSVDSSVFNLWFLNSSPGYEVVAYYSQNNRSIGLSGRTPKLKMVNLENGETYNDEIVLSSAQDNEESHTNLPGFYSNRVYPKQDTSYAIVCKENSFNSDHHQHLKVGVLRTKESVNIAEKKVYKSVNGSPTVEYDPNFHKRFRNRVNPEKYIRGTDFCRSFQIFNKNRVPYYLGENNVDSLHLIFSNQRELLEIEAEPYLNFYKGEGSQIWFDSVHPSVFHVRVPREEMFAFLGGEQVTVTGNLEFEGQRVSLGNDRYPFYAFEVILSKVVSPAQPWISGWR